MDDDGCRKDEVAEDPTRHIDKQYPFLCIHAIDSRTVADGVECNDVAHACHEPEVKYIAGRRGGEEDQDEAGVLRDKTIR